MFQSSEIKKKRKLKTQKKACNIYVPISCNEINKKKALLNSSLLKLITKLIPVNKLYGNKTTKYKIINISLMFAITSLNLKETELVKNLCRIM